MSDTNTPLPQGRLEPVEMGAATNDTVEQLQAEVRRLRAALELAGNYVSATITLTDVPLGWGQEVDAAIREALEGAGE